MAPPGPVTLRSLFSATPSASGGVGDVDGTTLDAMATGLATNNPGVIYGIDSVTREALLRALGDASVGGMPLVGNLWTNQAAFSSAAREEADPSVSSLSPDLSVPGLRRYVALGDAYKVKTDPHSGKQSYARTSTGLHNWGELLEFISSALTESGEPSIELNINQSDFSTLRPPPDFLSAVRALLSSPEAQSKNLSLVLHGDFKDVPVIYRFKDGDMTVSSQDTSYPEAASFWADERVQEVWQTWGREHREYPALLNALQQTHVELGEAPLGDFLERVIEVYNQNMEFYPDKKIQDTGRGKIFDCIHQLQTKLREIAVAVAQEEGLVPPPAALTWDPVFDILNHHPSSHRQSWVIIGAGQMGQAYARTLLRRIDHGILDLDADIILVQSSTAVIDELNGPGTNVKQFPGIAVNPTNNRRFHVLNLSQRDEALRAYLDRSKQTGSTSKDQKVVLLTVRVHQLGQVLDQRLLSAVAELQPDALGTPLKSFKPEQDDEGILPFRDGQRVLEHASPGLGGRLVLVGGFGEARKILLGSADVSQTAAGGDETAVHLIADGLDISERYVGADMAAKVNIDGAAKNATIYASGRRLMARALANPSPAIHEDWADLQALLASEKARNITIQDEVGARLGPHHGLSLVHLPTSQGAKNDADYCLPRSTVFLIERVRPQVAKIIRTGDLNLLKQLIAEIEIDKEGIMGTRNTRDGYIDQILYTVYDSLVSSDKFTGDFATFYKTYHPWQGEKEQEGRKAIAALIGLAQKRGIILPRGIYEAWNFYHPENLIDIPPEAQRDDAGLDGARLQPVWGLPEPWLSGWWCVMHSIHGKYTNPAHRLKTPKPSRVAQDLRNLKTAILTLSTATSLESHHGQYPEVTSRLLIIAERLENLAKIFDINGFSEEKLSSSVKALRGILSEVQRTFEEDVNDVSVLLIHLMNIAQKIHSVERILAQDEKAQQKPAASRRRQSQPTASALGSHAGVVASMFMALQGAGEVKSPGVLQTSFNPDVEQVLTVQIGGAATAELMDLAASGGVEPEVIDTINSAVLGGDSDAASDLALKVLGENPATWDKAQGFDLASNATEEGGMAFVGYTTPIITLVPILG